MLGALTLARAVEDPALATEILTAARAAFGKKRPAAKPVTKRKSPPAAKRKSRANGVGAAVP
jgi:hypothetical protein